MIDNTEVVRVLVVDDNPALVDGLSLVVNSTRHMRAVRNVGSSGAIADTVLALKPNVLVVDPHFLDTPVKALTARLSSLKCLAYCNPRDALPAEKYIEQGYSGVIGKKLETQKLLKAITVVAYGGSIIDPTLARPSTPTLPPLFTAALSYTADMKNEALTQREEAVLRRLAMGCGTKEIAADIRLSPKTVETYKSRAAKKLSLNNRSEIVQYAISKGWMSI